MSTQSRSSPTTSGFVRRRWKSLIVALICLVIAPSLISRILAPLRRVRSLEVRQHKPAVLPSKQIRLAIYNIAHGRGLAESNWDGGSPAERQRRLDAIASALKEWDADIVVLNEVDFECTWSSKIDQAAYLAREAGYRYVYEQRNVDARFLTYTWRFGNAVLSKFPCRSARPITYPTFVQWESFVAGQKHGMVCEFGEAENSFSLAAVHLESRDEATRQRSARLICEESPSILAGDFNSAPLDFPVHEKDADGHNAIAVVDQLDRYRRQPIDEPQRHELTFPADAPERVIDWIFIERTMAFGTYRVIDCEWSDHRPVVADLLLRGPISDLAEAGSEVVTGAESTAPSPSSNSNE